MTEKIIDFHNHIFPDKIAQKVVNQLGSYYGMEMHGTATIDNLLKLSKEAGMNRLVVHSTATKVEQVETINSYLGEVVREQNGYFIGFGTLHPDFEHVEEELDRMEQLGLKGLKLHPDFQRFEIDCDKMFRIYDIVGKRFPILMHTGDKHYDFSSPLRMRRAVDNFPDVTFIAAHFGGFSRWEEASEYLVGQNLYFDTSSSLDLLPDKTAVDMIRRHDAEKILYASDYPIVTHRYCLERFLKLDLTEEERDLILYRNAAELLNLKEEEEC